MFAPLLTLAWALQNFFILATSSAENVGTISLLISFTLLANRIVLQRITDSSEDIQEMPENLTFWQRTWHSSPDLRIVQIYTPEGPRGEAALFRRQTTVDPYNLHTVTWFHPVDEVIVCNDVNRTWQLSSRGFLWHLLNGQCLVVLIAAQPKLCLQRIVFFILHMQNLFHDS